MNDVAGIGLGLHNVGGIVDDESSIAAATNQAIDPAAGNERIVAGIGGEHAPLIVARRPEIGAPGQGEAIHVPGQHVAHRRLQRIIAGVVLLEHYIARVINYEGIVAASACHGGDTVARNQHICTAVTDEDIAPAISADERVSATERGQSIVASACLQQIAAAGAEYDIAAIALDRRRRAIGLSNHLVQAQHAAVRETNMAESARKPANNGKGTATRGDDETSCAANVESGCHG